MPLLRRRLRPRYVICARNISLFSPLILLMPFRCRHRLLLRPPLRPRRRPPPPLAATRARCATRSSGRSVLRRSTRSGYVAIARWSSRVVACHPLRKSTLTPCFCSTLSALCAAAARARSPMALLTAAASQCAPTARASIRRATCGEGKANAASAAQTNTTPVHGLY